jgi:hypothetical protein
LSNVPDEIEPIPAGEPIELVIDLPPTPGR